MTETGFRFYIRSKLIECSSTAKKDTNVYTLNYYKITILVPHYLL
jgi:hypothetical protein